jgi:hypothetical protein
MDNIVQIEITKIKSFKANHKKNAILRYINENGGIEKVISLFGTTDGFKKALLEAGFEYSWVYRVGRELEELLTKKKLELKDSQLKKVS